MNMHAKLPIRLSAAILAALLASSAFLTACSSGNSGTADTAAQTTANTTPAETTPVEEITRENYPDTLPEMDLQGSTVNVNVISDDAYKVDWVAEQKGDIIEDAVYARNMAVEERLKVKLNILTAHGARADKAAPVINAILAGDDAIQIVNIAAQSVASFLQSDLLQNMLDLPHLNFNQPWWNGDAMDVCRFNGQAYFATGEIAFRYLDGMAVYVFNDKVAKQFGITDIYDTFFAGNWTYDKLFAYTEIAHSDLNGDGSMTDADLWGLDTNTGANIDPYYASWDQPITKIGTSGFPEMCVNNDKMVSVVEKLYKLYNENPGCYNAGNSASGNIFTAGRALFAAQQITFVKKLREADFEFGVLTFPKFDEKQEQYYTHNRSGYSLYAIANPARNADHAAAVLEAAAAESYRKVTAVYIEEGLKLKYSRDAETGRVIDIMLAGIKPDFAFYTDIMYILREVLAAGTSNFSSFYASNEKVYQGILDDLKAKFAKNS